MMRANFRFIILASLLSMFSYMNVYAQVTAVTTVPPTTTTVPVPVTPVVTTQVVAAAPVVEKQVIVTAVPVPKEVIVTPSGYINCFIVKAGWYQDVWAAEHKVCQYPNTPNGVAWIEGYWECAKYDITVGQCTNWDWKAAHWENTLVVY